MKRNMKNTKRSGQNILRQGAAVAMAILLAMPVLPARAAEAGKGMEAVSIVPQMASVAMAAGAGGDAVAGSVASAMLTEDGGTNAQSVVNAEIVGGEALNCLAKVMLLMISWKNPSLEEML